MRSSATPVYGKGGRLLAYRGFTADVTAEVTAACAQQHRQIEQNAARARIEQTLADPDSVHIVLQPIADVATQRIVGACRRCPASPARQAAHRTSDSTKRSTPGWDAT
ncbi:hypothetical protein ACQP2F_14080 [Actinoplanes sp. CA-030573]|uniref:hypothetical protein n=1 Tax=Actinoplanes sp. CA-030573 TaxID=3239898 RepID=UPI003D8D648A